MGSEELASFGRIKMRLGRGQESQPKFSDVLKSPTCFSNQHRRTKLVASVAASNQNGTASRVSAKGGNTPSLTSVMLHPV